MTSMNPCVTILVPAYKRPSELLELLGRLRAQSLTDYEILVVEQSEDPEIVQRIEALGDPGIRVLVRPPLGLPGARNEGVRHARGEIVLMIDDDDLPISEDWAKMHLENFDDPLCMGVVGRLSATPENNDNPRFPRLVRRVAFRHTAFKDPSTYAFGSLRKENIDFLTFSGGSIRRSLFERAGGFDEGLPINEEHSFFFRYDKLRRPGEYFVFDPRPAIWRRLGVRGGLDRREVEDWHRRQLADSIFYYHAIVGRYFPWRFRLLYPAFAVRALVRSITWVWDPDNDGHGTRERVRASFELIVGLPKALWDNGVRRSRAEVRRVERL